jgi:hypothetical protein
LFFGLILQFIQQLLLLFGLRSKRFKLLFIFKVCSFFRSMVVSDVSDALLLQMEHWRRSRRALLRPIYQRPGSTSHPLCKLDAIRLFCSTRWLVMAPHHHISVNFPRLNIVGKHTLRLFLPLLPKFKRF